VSSRITCGVLPFTTCADCGWCTPPLRMWTSSVPWLPVCPWGVGVPGGGMSRGGPSGGRCGWCCGWSCSRGPLGRHRMYVGAGQPPVRVCCTASFSPPDARLDPSGQLWTVPLWMLSCRPHRVVLHSPPRVWRVPVGCIAPVVLFLLGVRVFGRLACSPFCCLALSPSIPSPCILLPV
jgi:hypothetical protein